jgi:hypothetical protein
MWILSDSPEPEGKVPEHRQAFDATEISQSERPGGSEGATLAAAGAILRGDQRGTTGVVDADGDRAVRDTCQTTGVSGSGV